MGDKNRVELLFILRDQRKSLPITVNLFYTVLSGQTEVYCFGGRWGRRCEKGVEDSKDAISNWKMGARAGQWWEHSPPRLVWSGFKFQRRRDMWVEFVFDSLPCNERFSSGYYTPVFPRSSKTNISKFQFDQESGRRRTTMWMCYLLIVIYLYFYLKVIIYFL